MARHIAELIGRLYDEIISIWYLVDQVWLRWPFEIYWNFDIMDKHLTWYLMYSSDTSTSPHQPFYSLLHCLALSVFSYVWSTFLSHCLKITLLTMPMICWLCEGLGPLLDWGFNFIWMYTSFIGMFHIIHSSPTPHMWFVLSLIYNAQRHDSRWCDYLVFGFREHFCRHVGYIKMEWDNWEYMQYFPHRHRSSTSKDIWVGLDEPETLSLTSDAYCSFWELGYLDLTRH